jgi:hypothetical protein
MRSRSIPYGRCQLCGCTNTRPCPGGCGWFNHAHTLCTRCAAILVRWAATLLLRNNSIRTAHSTEPPAIAVPLPAGFERSTPHAN